MTRILTSHTYQHRYDPAREDHFDVQKPDAPRYFRTPTLRRVTAEQFIDSVRLVTRGSLDRRERVYEDRISTALTRALGRPASRNEISTSRPEDTAVLTALELMNGPELSYLVYSSPRLTPLASSAKPAERDAAIDRLYVAALGRRPLPAERKAARTYLAASRVPSPAMAPSPADEMVFDDALPEEAKADGSGGPSAWAWVEPQVRPPNGPKAHAQSNEGDIMSHKVTGLAPVTLAAKDRLVTWVYLDPARPPREIMIEWLAGTEWEHRAYWADEQRSGRETPHRRWMGPLPKIGTWVRLDVPGGEVGILDTTAVTGWSFVQVGGAALWDAAAVSRVAESPGSAALGDLLWALLAGPEFTFIQ